MTLTAFLLARIAEDEADDMGMGHRVDCARLGGWPGDPSSVVACDCGVTARVLAECEAKRQIVEWHESWHVQIETQPEVEPAAAESLEDMMSRMARQITWVTNREYVERFGAEPPSTPMLRALASVYAEHPDYLEEWRQ